MRAAGGTARRAAALMVFVLLWAAPLATGWAAADEMDTGEAGQGGFDAPGDDAWLWADPDELFLLDEGLLFGGDGLFSESQEAESAAPHEVFLVTEGVDVGGSYDLSTNLAWSRGAEGSGSSGGELEAQRWAELAGSLFFDYRPSVDFRAFAKLKGDAVLDESGPQSKIWLHELFADFDVGDRAFFRVGKQTVNWGVGYFFSPADIINIGRIDPEEPEAEREGPVAVRIHLLAGRVNYDVYTLVHGKPGDYRIALAPKAEFVYGGSEVGLGLYYRADRAPRAMATLSTSPLGRVAVFGEAVASFGSDKRFVKEAPGTLLGLSVYEDPDTVRFHFTAGARVNHSDPDGRFTVMAAGQYYYNGEGYDGEFLKENLGKMYGLVAMGQLASSDVLPLTVGRHYAALSVSGTSSSLRNVTPSVFWLGNLSDGSGMVTFSLGYTGWKDVRPSVSVSRMYGAAGSELAPTGPSTRFTVGVSFGRSF